MKKKPVKSPPKWADRFLAWYCNPKLLEQIQGDVHELYYWRIKEKGESKARRSFIWDVLRLFKWSNIKRSNKSQNRNNMGIFKNYFKIGLRNLWKQRMPSAINIIGLSLAIGCSIVAFKFVEYNYVKDDFHENKDDLFLVTHWEELESNKGRNGGTDNQLVGEILKSVPGIKASTRYNYQQPEVRYGNKTKYEAALFVDEAFMDMFSFDLLYGNPNTLYNEGEIIIDESTSISLFGDANPVGEKVDLKIRENWKTFTIGAVYRDKPNNSSIQINMLVNYVHFEQEFKDRDTWNTRLFIQREEGVEPARLLSAMDQLLPVYNKDNEETAIIYFELEPLSTMANNSYEMMNGVGSGPSMAPIITLSAIGVFMLILSTLNYVNISLAMIMKRLKEIGIRKVIGSKRKQLVTQFLIENFLLCAFSMFLGVLLAHSFFLPGFNEIAGGDFKLDLWSHLNFWYFLIGLLLFITLASGLYPAIVASSYKPISILRKAPQKSGKRWLSNIFLTFQMILAMITVVTAIMFVHTNRVNESMDWGYDQYDKLVMGIPGEEYRDAYRDVLEAEPNVARYAGTRSNIGQDLNGVQFQNGEVKSYAELFQVGRNYPELLGLSLVAGRMFDPSLESDLDRKLVVNESFLEQYQLEFNADGVQILQDSVEYTIIGVVEDYHYMDPGQKIRGAALKAIPANEFTSYLVKMNEGNIFDQRDKLQSQLQELVEEKTVYVGIQELIFEGFYEEMKGIRNIMLFTASVSILLAAMGLYGLVSINVSSQIKDFGIRKVLGASGMNLTSTVAKKFRFVLLFAILIGCPVAVLLVDMLINDIYAYAPNIGAGPLSIAVLILLLVTFFTLNLQIRRVKRMNPAQTLRTE
ncbi:ABC transporter permease [uncultured Roseivirga sp.]|uniref:ABC transporter permease n=1 Tax=uncultured Roseivirga sp. TaxID=543088 RepID=UPI000D7A0BFD|nr:ABC transporter permease [uncultured Roseivirga sp.]PWL28340.1 MAG: hypothetical protein DCO95_13265 [Roseivirga sp. XM-24bin3]